MSFALAGTKIPGVTIDEPQCVAKSYPDFWAHLDRVHARSRAQDPVGYGVLDLNRLENR